MYDADVLVEKLTTQDVLNILKKLGATTIIDETEDKQQIITNTICHNESGGSHKLYYLEDRKRFHCFTSCGSLSIYDLIIERHSLKGIALSFPEAISWLAVNSGNAFTFGEDTSFNRTNEELKWMQKFKRNTNEAPELKTYSEYALQVFTHHGGHMAFTKDNIDEIAMDRFNIRYDWANNALIIPHRSWKSGKIIGMMSRNLNQWQVDAGFKYVPTQIQSTQYSFPKHLNLYGLWENRENIKALKKVALFESEKSVMQCETYFGEYNNFAVALGGKYLSDEQVKMLVQLGVEQVILNFDKDFDDINDPAAQIMIKHILSVARKLTPYMRVFTTFDKEGLLDKHDSPSDKGKDVLIRLFNNKEEILNVT